MKKILLPSALIIALNVGAQTVKEDTIVHYTYVSIRTTVIKQDTATRLRVVQCFDNMELSEDRAQTVFHWYLMNDSSRIILDGDQTIEKQDYANWNANSLSDTYSLVADKLKLTIVK